MFTFPPIHATYTKHDARFYVQKCTSIHIHKDSSAYTRKLSSEKIVFVPVYRFVGASTY